MISEKILEKKVCDFAKSKGWLTYKFVSPSNNGVPDRIFLRNGTLIFVEFKRRGKGLRKLQKHVKSKIEHEGFNVYVIDDYISALEIF